MNKTYYVYIMSNYTDTTLYIGVTNNLSRRLEEHKSGGGSFFTAKYRCNKLVYYETFTDVNQAIEREKQLKGWKRFKKELLIDSVNKERMDLSGEILCVV